MRRRSLCLAIAALAFGCPGPEPIDPIFPADYASRFTEARDCRRSPEHDLSYIRIYANAGALEVYQTRTGDFPEGAILVKEEYADPSCTDRIGWTAMIREGGDWHWQELASDRVVIEDGAIRRCAGCHAACVAPEGYQGTCAVP